MVLSDPCRPTTMICDFLAYSQCSINVCDDTNYCDGKLNSLEIFFEYKYPRYHNGQKMKSFLAC